MNDNFPKTQANVPQSNVQKLKQMFVGNPAGGPANADASMGASSSAGGKKRNRLEDGDPVNPV